jgi:hypothetical protein
MPVMATLGKLFFIPKPFFWNSLMQVAGTAFAREIACLLEGTIIRWPTPA